MVWLLPSLRCNRTYREGAAWVNPELRASNGGWVISSIWLVWLVGPEIYPAEPERPSIHPDKSVRVARAQKIGSAALTFLIGPCLPLFFFCLHPSLIGGVHVHRDRKLPEMLFHQRLHVFPVKPTHTGSQAWQCDTLEFLGLNRLA
ncbi:MAG: hypothetical protein RL042_1391 [Nitrospirota bacterium]